MSTFNNSSSDTSVYRIDIAPIVFCYSNRSWGCSPIVTNEVFLNGGVFVSKNESYLLRNVRSKYFSRSVYADLFFIDGREDVNWWTSFLDFWRSVSKDWTMDSREDIALRSWRFVSVSFCIWSCRSLFDILRWMFCSIRCSISDSLSANSII